MTGTSDAATTAAAAPLLPLGRFEEGSPSDGR